MTRKGTDVGSPLAILADALRGAPNLIEASCIGNAHLFDPDHGHETTFEKDVRHSEAVEVCAACPVLASCRRWAQSLPEWELVGFVVAGETRQSALTIEHLTPRTRARIRSTSRTRRTA